MFGSGRTGRPRGRRSGPESAGAGPGIFMSSGGSSFVFMSPAGGGGGGRGGGGGIFGGGPYGGSRCVADVICVDADDGAYCRLMHSTDCRVAISEHYVETVGVQSVWQCMIRDAEAESAAHEMCRGASCGLL